MEQHTVSHDAGIVVLDHTKQRWPLGEVVEVESQIIILRQRVQVGQVQVQQVQRGHAPYGSHLGLEVKNVGLMNALPFLPGGDGGFVDIGLFWISAILLVMLSYLLRLLAFQVSCCLSPVNCQVTP